MMGGSKTVADRQTSIQIQQSAYGMALPVVYGTNRVAANLIWFGNFQSISHTTKTGGKGLGGSSSNTDYTYTAAAVMALAEGPITGIGAVWKDKDKTTLSDLGLTLFTGTASQPVWSFLSGWNNTTDFAVDVQFGYADLGATFVDQAINYSSTAYLASSAYDLGTAATVPNHNFEVQGFCIVGSGNEDANPGSIIPDMLTSQQYGIGLTSGQIDSMTDYTTYCRATGIFVSPAYTQQRPAADCIQELADATNTAPVWSGGKLKIIPYGDVAVTGNGVTYTPNLTPAYDLTDDDFVGTGADPIAVTRSTPADAYNRVQVQFRNRSNQYNQEVVSVEDQDAIEKYGLKIAPVLQLDFICSSSIAKQVAQLALQRYLYKRNVYEFELNARFAMLEPMDIVTLADPGMSMSRTPVRLTTVEEIDDGFRCTAEDLPIGVANAATYHHDDGLRWQNDTSLTPLDAAAPIIFELPADPSATGLSVGLAAGGQPGDLLYGGCRVWISLDGTNYREEGVILGSSRYGTLSATLPSHAAGVDTTNTAHLSLRSDAQMLSGSAADMNKGVTDVICNGEYFSYQTATLTGTRAYDLSTLNRGLYGTTGGSHASGSPWVRIDNNIAVLKDMDLTMIGQTIYIKLTAFNIYGNAEQDLASVGSYTYTITGDMKALESPVDFASIAGVPPITSNLVPDSLFETGVLDWAETVDASGIGTSATTGIGSTGYFLDENFTATAANQTLGLGALSGGNAYFNVVAGQRYAFQCTAVATGPMNSATGKVYWYDSSGSLLSDTSFATVSASPPNSRLQGFATAPSNAVRARIDVLFNTSGSGSGTVLIRQPQASVASVDQTIFPVFVPGPSTGTGQRSVVLDMYKWASSTPGTYPSGTSTFTWATGLFTAPATTNGWTLTPGSGSPGQTLYVISQYYTDALTTPTSSVTWSSTSPYPAGYAGTNGSNGSNGSNGTNGQRTAVIEMYKWDTATPTSFPSGTSTYTWSTGAWTTPATTNGWTTTPGTPPGVTSVLYGVTATYTDNLTTSTSSITWPSSPTPYPLTPTLGALAGLGSVATANINANAVTNLTSAYTSGTTTISYTSGYTQIQSITFTATGEEVMVSFATAVNSTSSDNFGVRIMRGATLIYQAEGMQCDSAVTSLCAGSIVDVPSAGSVTYSLEAKVTIGAGDLTPGARSLSALETKR